MGLEGSGDLVTLDIVICQGLNSVPALILGICKCHDILPGLR